MSNHQWRLVWRVNFALNAAPARPWRHNDLFYTCYSTMALVSAIFHCSKYNATMVSVSQAALHTRLLIATSKGCDERLSLWQIFCKWYGRNFIDRGQESLNTAEKFLGHIIVNILPKIWLSRPSGLPCEFRIKDKFIRTRPVFVHINPFLCVNTGLTLPTYRYGGSALGTTSQNLNPRMGKGSELKSWKKSQRYCFTLSWLFHSNDDRRRSGRPRASIPHDNQYQCRITRRHRFIIVRMLQAEWELILPERVSMQNVRNRLVFSSSPRKTLQLTSTN